MIFMLQMQYNVPNYMYVFQKIFGETPPDPLLVLGHRLGPRPLSPGCTPAVDTIDHSTLYWSVQHRGRRFAMTSVLPRRTLIDNIVKYWAVAGRSATTRFERSMCRKVRRQDHYSIHCTSRHLPMRSTDGINCRVRLWSVGYNLLRVIGMPQGSLLGPL